MSQANERQDGQHGPGGWRSVPHDTQRWMTRRRCAAAANQKLDLANANHLAQILGVDITGLTKVTALDGRRSIEVARAAIETAESGEVVKIA